MHKGQMPSQPRVDSWQPEERDLLLFIFACVVRDITKLSSPLKVPAGAYLLFPRFSCYWKKKNSKKSFYLQSKAQWLINMQTPVRL